MHARQVLVAASQIGFVPPHWAAAMQPVQVPEGASQVDAAPAHAVAFVAEQTPHAPEGWQAGVEPEQSASLVQPRHACVVASHFGVVPLHAASAKQPTQVEVVASQIDVVPTQRVAFVAEHWPHAPEGSHAGVEAVVQSVSAAQARHTCVVVLHVGVVPEQSVLPRHATQLPVVVLQTPVVPVHWVLFVAEHAPHEPLG